MKADCYSVAVLLFFAGGVNHGMAAEGEATHREVSPIKITLGPGGEMTTIAMDRSGNILAGVTWYANGKKDQKRYGIKKISPAGKVLQTWPLAAEFKAKMIHGCDDGRVYVAGHGFLGIFDENGRELERLDVDEKLDYKAAAAGLYVSKDYVFVAYGSGRSLRATEEIYRFNLDLTGMKKEI
jgi:hypothetical protein